jgi:hypothetical protein
MRRLVVLAVAVIALVASGCKDSESQKTSAETEGLYLRIDGLTYQIQMSRYLNPNDIEDSEYLVGLPGGTAQPAGDDVFFGVWVRVQNESDQARRSANTWEIHDTQDNVYRPIPLDTNINPFAFEKGVAVPPMGVVPNPSSAAGQGPIQGSLLLFKLKTDSLQNRPLELHFNSGGDSTVGVYDLDV